jgi:arylsulfatase A-like enzyme
MTRTRRLILAAGDGALAGAAVGGVLGIWQVRLGKDLSHGLYWLAGERVLGPALTFSLWGIAISALLWLLLSSGGRLAERPRRTLVSIVVLVALGGLILSAGTLRDHLFPLRWHGSPRLAILSVIAILLASTYLLVCRLRDLLRGEEDRSHRSAVQGGAADGKGQAFPEGGIPVISRTRAVLSAAGFLVVALVAAGSVALPWMATRRAAGSPSIILVSIDTMRADRLGALGSGRSLTPRLDELAAEGMVFEQASSTAPWTLPSHVSLFTSLMPFDHHTRWSWMRVHPERLMLAESFRNAGYRTAAFTGGGYVASTYGFDQGFETYEDHDEMLEGGPEGIASSALSWARRNGEEPFLMFVHTYEPHSPFVHGEYASLADAGQLPDAITFREVQAIHDGELVLTESERRFVTDLYDGDVAHADAVFGGMLAKMRDEGILENTILVVFSDHGEDLWDHSDIRSPGHGHSLYEELIRIPLVVRAPGLVPAGARIATPVSLLDIAPTLLELAGLPASPIHQGRSLAETWRTGNEPAVAPVMAESVEYGPDRFSRRLGNLKVVLTPTPDVAHHGILLPVQPLELYDLGADPRELENLFPSTAESDPVAAAQPGMEDPAAAEGGPHETLAAAEPLVSAVRERVETKLLRGGEGPGSVEAEEIPEELRRQLRALGYTD